MIFGSEKSRDKIAALFYRNDPKKFKRPCTFVPPADR